MHKIWGYNAFRVNDNYYRHFNECYRRIGKYAPKRIKLRPESMVIDLLHRMSLDHDYSVALNKGGERRTLLLRSFLPLRPEPEQAGGMIRVQYGQYVTETLTAAQWNFEADVADNVAEAVMEPLSIAMATRRSAAVVVAGVIVLGEMLLPGWRRE